MLTVNSVRLRSKPSLTPQMQFLVRLSQANSTASCGAAEHLAPHAPVEAADAAAGRAQALALEVGRGLDVLPDRIDLRRPRRQTPELPRPHAAADRDIVDIGDRGALRDGRGCGRRFA